MIEGHTFQTAHFTDNERSNVTSLWVDDEGTVRPCNMSSEENDPNFQELLKYITIDELHENTGNVIKSIQRAYEEDIMTMAEADGIDVMSLRGIGNAAVDAVANWITAKYNDEQVFKIKLRLFEHDKVKDSTDTKKKSALRKAKSVPEIVEAYSKF